MGNSALKKETLTVTQDFTQDFLKVIDRYRNDKVLVGIPQSDSAREDEDGITNAALLAMNNFGSPARNLPARPVMDIGIRNAQDAITEEYKKAAKESLKKGLDGLDRTYERVGMIASNSIKAAINSQEGIAPPAPATLALRKSQGFKGTKALIRTGQMRNSITYVVKKGL